LAVLHTELVELAKQLAIAEGRAGAAEAQAAAVRAQLEEVRAQRDAQVAVLEALIEVERCRAGELRDERDRLLGHLTATQADHAAHVGALSERIAGAERDRDRVVAELSALLALPWWRRILRG